MSRTRLLSAAAACALLQVATGGLAHAQASADAGAPIPTADDSSVGEIVVFGRGELKIGVAQSASEGTVGGSDLLVRPLLRTAELLEAVPGMVAAQHSGSGKANQYFLRGFNLDHGSDFTTYIDGVQMNLRTHGHGQGYLDLNGLIPEIIDREDYRKGPYHADGGDFALAGAAYMTTINRYEHPWVSAEAGSWNSKRLAGGGTADVANGELTFVGEAKYYDGPWEQPEHLRHYAAFAKYQKPTSIGDLELTAHGYRGTWRPTEQIPERIIGSAYCADEFCSPDPTATGETTRLVFNAKLSDSGWRANASAQYYDWDMFSNPTYANADGSSAQIHQFDKRWVFGLNAEKIIPVSTRFDLTVGTENRYDAMSNVGVYQTAARAFVASLGAYKVGELSGSLYGEATWRPIDPLRITGGLRGDYYHLDVEANDAEAAALGVGKDHDAITSAKLMAAYKLTDTIEVYGNWGQGFHSNDVRGVVNTVTPVPTLVRGVGKEVGARFQLSHFTLTTTYWWLSVGSELKFVGDSNAVEPTGASSRHGYEIVAFWRPRPWLAIDANYTASHSRYDNGDYIPNAFDNAAQIGISAVLDRWEGSLRMRHLGGYPLIEDNSLRDKGSTVFNARGAWKPGNIEVYAEVLNILDSHDKDIAYYYESYIPGFDAAPVEGRLSRVVEPRTFRVGAKYNF